MNTIDVLNQLRSAGVKTFTGKDQQGDEFSVEFFAGEPEPSGDDAEPNRDECKCGHPVYEHINGLCGNGCDESACDKGETQ